MTVTLTSNEPATATLTLTVDRATARKFKLDKKAKGPVTIGAGTATLGAGAKNATVKLSAKARKSLKKARSGEAAADRGGVRRRGQQGDQD